MNRRRLTVMVAFAVVAALLAATAATAARLTRTAYLAKLRAADAVSSRADNGAVAALQAKQTTAAQVRASFYAMGKTHVRIAMAFAAIAPPPAATEANRDFVHAELVLGRQNEAIALRMPKTKQAIMTYLRSLQPPSGGKLLDRAIAELHARGFTVRRG